ncbi:MAG: U32 family peptidase [Magnetococcales bacterium]|nr:U32 family peptidase [Magnetococcales bacterium]
MKIAIGPVLFEWGKKELRRFYHQMAYESAADILYIGEVVCGRRSHLTVPELLQLAQELQPSGKEIVFSTFGLVMNDEEQLFIRQLVTMAQQHGLMVEVNDMAGLAIGEGSDMVAGPHINSYNPETIAFLATVGVRRVVFPVELSRDMIAAIIRKRPPQPLEYELFAWGRLPLSLSARCYTARAFQLSKANCQYRCGDYPDGLPLHTQTGEPFLTINGVQMMSDATFNLIREIELLQQIGVDVVRLSPQSQGMLERTAVWRQRLDGQLSAIDGQAALTRLDATASYCNGYFYGQAGLDLVEAVATVVAMEHDSTENLEECCHADR